MTGFLHDSSYQRQQKFFNSNEALLRKSGYSLWREVNWRFYWDWDTFWTKSSNDFFIGPKKKLFSHKKFGNPCRGSYLALYWKKLHNHYNWRVSTFEPLHGFSKFLWLNNFFLGAMKKSLHDFVQKVSQSQPNLRFMQI